MPCPPEEFPTLPKADHSAWFGSALREAFVRKFGRKCTASLFALKFNTQIANLDRGISVETARRWLKGLSFPEPKRMRLIIEWLEIESVETSLKRRTAGASQLSANTSYTLPCESKQTVTLELSAADIENLRRVLLPILTQNQPKGRTDNIT